MRRVLLLLPLALACAGYLQGQDASMKKQMTTAVSSDNPLVREVQAFANKVEDAKQRNDRKALESFYADDFRCKDERFGIGEVLSKKAYLDRRGSGSHGPEDQVIKLQHSKVSWLVFGNTVIRSGYSTTILKHQGRLSKGPRLFSFVYVKQNGRWQVAAEDVFDIPNGYEEHLDQ